MNRRRGMQARSATIDATPPVASGEGGNAARGASTARLSGPERLAAGPRLHLHTDRVRLYHGDSSEASLVIAPESIDAIVTDPPAGIAFMGREWDSDKGGRDAWIAWLAGILRSAMALLRPGGHALVWALPRTSHWTARAVEDAGFEIRDKVFHLFGSGFPKSLSVSKAIDDAAGAMRPVVGRGKGRTGAAVASHRDVHGDDAYEWPGEFDVTAPATPAAAQWSGWGTALKPAAEEWILARKPLVGTVASNVQRFGTGAINVDGCRIGVDGGTAKGTFPNGASVSAYGDGLNGACEIVDIGKGRWPAHLVLSHLPECGETCAPGCAVAMLDEQSGTLTSGSGGKSMRTDASPIAMEGGVLRPVDGDWPASTGGASRFFYCAKPARSEKDAGLDHLPLRTGEEITGREEGSAGSLNPRAGAGSRGGVRNHHPTVKSIELMRWLCRLITPPGGTVLDLFAGSGTTGLAALREGFRFVGIEREAAFVDVAAGRLAHVECVAPPPLADEETEKVEPTQPSLFDARTA